MSNVIPFHPHKNNSSSDDSPPEDPHRPGIVDIFPERHGMVLIDGCIPAKALGALLALLGTAGVTVMENL